MANPTTPEVSGTRFKPYYGELKPGFVYYTPKNQKVWFRHVVRKPLKKGQVIGGITINKNETIAEYNHYRKVMSILRADGKIFVRE